MIYIAIAYLLTQLFQNFFFWNFQNTFTLSNFNNSHLQANQGKKNIKLALGSMNSLYYKKFMNMLSIITKFTF